MQRTCMGYLVEWLYSKRRKPLVMRGARQVGKTWLVRDFAQKEGKVLVEVNFEEHPEIVSSFETNDPKKILLRLESALNQDINPETALMFLDEIQAVPELIAKLRWFAEKMPQLPVIAAGSLLEFTLRSYQASMPVGRISYMYVEPFSFEEFLLALGKRHLLRDIKSFTWGDDIAPHTHSELTRLFKDYVLVGGMPAAVATWVDEYSLKAVGVVHTELFTTYKDDFRKYSGRLDPDVLADVLTYIPKKLGEKFVYSQVRSQARVETVKKGLDLLCLARVAHKVQRSPANGLPLAAEVHDTWLKVILLDVGLCSAALDVTYEHIQQSQELELVNKGGLAEQVVGQLLRTLNPCYKEAALYYWIRPKAGSSAEVDYVTQYKGAIVPIEVKAGSTGRLKSLQVFMGLKKLSLAVRINSALPVRTTIETQDLDGKPCSYDLRSLPFYLISELYRLCD